MKSDSFRWLIGLLPESPYKIATSRDFTSTGKRNTVRVGRHRADVAAARERHGAKHARGVEWNRDLGDRTGLGAVSARVPTGGRAAHHRERGGVVEGPPGEAQRDVDHLVAVDGCTLESA